MTKQDPCGFAQCPSHVSYRRIDGDDQIQLADDDRQVAIVAEPRLQIMHMNVRREISDVFVASTLLQTIESDLRNAQDRQKLAQRTRAMAIVTVVNNIRPDNADSGVL